MSEWKEYSVSEICEKITDGSHFSPKETKDGNRIIATVKDMTKSSFDYQKCKRISEEYYLELVNSGCKAEKDDVLLSKDGTIGLVQLFKDNVDLVLLSSIAILKANRNIITPVFLSYLLKSPNFQNDIKENFKTGSALPRITLKDLKLIQVSLPPLPEQRAIADVLSSLDSKIDLLHRQNKTLEDIAETLWRKMFVEEADPDWDEKGLDEIADFLNGLPCQKYPPDTADEPLPVIKIKELRGGFTDGSDMATSAVPLEYIINDGDILFSWSGSLEIIIWSFGKGVLNQHLFKVTSNKYPKWFYYYAIKQHLSEFRDIAEDKATTMGHIQRHHLTAAEVAIPDKVSFEYLNTQIGPIFEKKIHNLKAIRTYAKLRDTILPKLMSGKVRVKYFS